MKKIALISFGLLLAFAVKAQDDKSGSVKKLQQGDRLMIGIYQDLWQDAPDTLDLRGINQGFSISSMYDKPLGTSNFSLAVGVGIGVHNFFSDGDLTADKDTVQFTKYADSISYDNNKFTTAYVDIPLEVRFRTKNEKKSKQFKIAVGGKVGMLMSSHTKYKGDNLMPGRDGDWKYKQHNIESVEKIRYGATFRVGRGSWNLFGYYSLSQIFEDDKGCEMYPISVGIMITPF